MVVGEGSITKKSDMSSRSYERIFVLSVEGGRKKNIDIQFGTHACEPSLESQQD
jgi:hypothetical protein